MKSENQTEGQPQVGSDALFGFCADDGETVIWVWQPDPADFVKFDDVATAYVITACESASSGKVVLYAKYGSQWTCNPWTCRPVLARMLGKVGGVVHEPNETAHLTAEKGKANE